MASTAIGAAVVCDLVRSEGDTDDIPCHLTTSAGADATVVGWTALLSVGNDNDTLLTGSQATYPGTGISGGLIPIDMDLFDIPTGDYKYDIRIIDTVSPGSPARVYYKGKFKVTPRIN